MTTDLVPEHQPHLYRFVTTPDGHRGQIVDQVTRTFWNGHREVNYQDFYVQSDDSSINGWFTQKRMAQLGWTFEADKSLASER